MQSRNRRSFIGAIAGAIGIGALAACGAPAPAPATAQPAQPTTAPAAPTAAPKAPAPTAAPKAAATQAPAKQAFTPVTLKGITIEDYPDNVWWVLGQEKGFFQDYGINISFQGVQGGTQVIAALVGGEVDIADQSPSTMLTIAAKDQTVKGVGGSRPGLAYVIVAQKNVNSLKDLEGKSMGISARGALMDQITRHLLTKAGADPEKVTYANIGSQNAIYKAVAAGKVDGGISDIGSASFAARDGLKIIVDVRREMPGFMRGAFWATTKTIAEKGDALARLMAAFAKTYRFATTPEAKDLFMKISQEKFAASPELAQTIWDYFTTNLDVLARNLEMPEPGIQLAQQLNVDVGNMPAVLPYNRVIDLSLQTRALELAGKV